MWEGWAKGVTGGKERQVEWAGEEKEGGMMNWKKERKKDRKKDRNKERNKKKQTKKKEEKRNKETNE